MKNNLETLCLNFSYLNNLKIDNDVFNSLNNLKSLEHIEFIYLQFSKPFKIILPNLKTINFHNCKNIVFDENSTKNIKYLELNKTDIQFGIKYKFDNLEVLNINKSNIDIDFISLTKIKSLKSSKIEIIENIINYSSLEKFSNLYMSQLSFKEEQKLIEIILMNKTLKKIEIELNENSNKELSEYLINNQINKLKLKINKDNYDIINFLKRFINIKELTIFYYSDNKDTFTEIKNDENIIIDKINIYSNLNTIISFSFSNIKKIRNRNSNQKNAKKFIFRIYN